MVELPLLKVAKIRQIKEWKIICMIMFLLQRVLVYGIFGHCDACIPKIYTYFLHDRRLS